MGDTDEAQGRWLPDALWAHATVIPVDSAETTPIDRMAAHNVRHDRAGWGGRLRLTCYSDGRTLVAQPYMTQEVWTAKVADFMKEHPCRLLPAVDCGLFLWWDGTHLVPA